MSTVAAWCSPAAARPTCHPKMSPSEPVLIRVTLVSSSSPDQEPVTFDVASPQGRQIANELVDPVAGFQRFACDEPFDDLPEPLFVLAAPGGPAEVPF